MKKNQLPLIGEILKKVAPRAGAVVVMEPQWEVVGQLSYKNGLKRYFNFSSLDLNPMGASSIAKDKDYANFFMARMKYPTIAGKTFFSNEWSSVIDPSRNVHAAWRYAQSLGLPVVVKPNSGTRGKGVALVHTRREFYRAMRVIFKQDKVALVQRRVSGRDYRIVVLDQHVISAYERIPLNVTGDGRTTILGLLKKKQQAFIGGDRDTRIKLDDPRFAEKLRRQSLTLKSVPPKGQTVFLLDSANLSTGGDSIDVTTRAHPAFRQLAIALTRDMGLRFCGVDLMVEGDIAQKPAKFWVLEINSAPGLDHYARTGKAQRKIVEDLYLKVVRSLGRASPGQEPG